MNFNWPFVTRSRYQAALAEIKDLRHRVLDIEARHEETERKHRSLVRQLTAADSANGRLASHNRDLVERLAVQKQRADQMEADTTAADREAIEAWEARVKAHDTWMPPIGPDVWEKRPIDSASARPQHPAVELRRALERCRKLQALLEGRGKRVTP